MVKKYPSVHVQKALISLSVGGFFYPCSFYAQDVHSDILRRSISGVVNYLDRSKELLRINPLYRLYNDFQGSELPGHFRKDTEIPV